MYGAIPNKETFEISSSSGHTVEGFETSLKYAATFIGLFQVFLFLLYGMTGAQVGIVEKSTTFDAGYGLFLGVEIMMFIGFGYLMVGVLYLVCLSTLNYY